MKWLKNNSIKIFMALVNTFLLTSLMLSSYDVKGGDLKGYSLTLLSAVVPVLLISAGIIGAVSEKKFQYLLLALIGAALLTFTFRFSPELLGKEITSINMKLGNSEVLVFSDFKLLIQTLGVFLTLISVLSIYIYPWNILITDLALIFFLWAVDYLTKAGERLIPFAFLWAVLLTHERSLSRDIQFQSYKEKKIDTKGRTFQVAVIGLLVGAITVGILGFNKGIYYDRLWVKANDFLMQDEFMAGNKFLNAFSLKNSGYNDSSVKLGGDIKLDANVMLTVTGDAPGYLRGNTKYQYTGDMWLRNNFIYRTENSASADVTHKYKSAKVRKMKIIPQGIRTSSIFVPSYPETVIVEDRRPDLKLYYSIKDQTFVLDQVSTSPYEVSFYDENDVKSQAASSANDSYSDEMSAFLEVPETVSKRTYDLVNEITAGLTSSHEKMEAIKSYLTSNYTYTLTPGDTPQGEDFVDNFLFEKKEGYCVHFASSMTIMARIAGIPARYAEGYKVPEEKSSDGTVYVKNEDAHAWTEVLTDGKNEVWTIYDSTGSARDHENEKKNEGEKDKKKEENKTKPETKPDTKPKPQTKPQESPSVKPPSEKDDLKNTSPSKLLIIPLLLLLALAAMVIRKMIIMRRLLKDREGAFLNFASEMAADLGYTSSIKGNNLTYMEFIRRIESEDDEIRHASEAYSKDNMSEETSKVSENSSETEEVSYPRILAPLVNDWYISSYGAGEKILNEADRKDILIRLFGLLKERKGTAYAFVKQYLL